MTSVTNEPQSPLVPTAASLEVLENNPLVQRFRQSGLFTVTELSLICCVMTIPAWVTATWIYMPQGKQDALVIERFHALTKQWLANAATEEEQDTLTVFMKGLKLE